jgi:selenocysteine-specific elongation factor
LAVSSRAAAVRAGRLVRLAPGVGLLPATVDRAVAVPTALPQRFTAGQAREALGTSRKVVVPLPEHLAQRGRTRRHDDGTHAVTGR